MGVSMFRSSDGRGLKGLRFLRDEGGKWSSSSGEELSHRSVSIFPESWGCW